MSSWTPCLEPIATGRERGDTSGLCMSLSRFSLLLVFIVNFNDYLMSISYILIVAIVMVSVFQPYRNKWYNVIDVILFFAILHCALLIDATRRETKIILGTLRNVLIPLSLTSAVVAIAVFLSYGAIVLTAILLPKKLFKQLLERLAGFLKKRKAIQLDDSLPYRLKDSERDPLVQ